MNSLDPFEERLRRTPWREAPASLRREVLRAAQTTAPWKEIGANPIRGWFEGWNWPHRAAWATLGLAWIAIVVLNLAALQTEGNAPDQGAPPRISPALVAALREQRALLDYLLAEPTSPAGSPTPGPDAGLWLDSGRGLV